MDRFHSFTRATVFLCILLMTVPGDTAVQLNPLTTASLAYVSDYFSFVGADEQGHVAFALDNNRGRDGEAYQAEHFAILHDERQGWIGLVGSGPYVNAEKELIGIPDSKDFRFTGTPTSGLTMSSDSNSVTLRIDPIPERMRRRHDESIVWMGTAPGVLTWQGRTIHGRVIYEYLAMPNFNRLTHSYPGLWKDYQGLYLTADGENDVYLHS